MISNQLLFLFSALGAVNGIFLALYLFSRRSHRMANRLLGTLLMAIGLRTAKSTFYYFNPDLAAEYLQLGLSACLLIGPLTYLYVHYHLADLAQRAASQQWRWHLLLSLILIGIGMIFPYSRYSSTWYYFICGIHAYWFVYLLLAGRELWVSRAVLLGVVSRKNLLVLSVYFGSFLILAAYVSTPFTSYIVGALSFTFSIHITILSYVLQNELNTDEGKKEKYQNRKLSEKDARELMESLNKVMREQQLYLNPLLNLATLAKKVGNLQTTISQVINENSGKSFNLYINEFRIQHAQKLLVTDTHLNLELVAERSGFNSNSTFFTAFKKIAGQTPASYRAFAAGAVSSSPDKPQ
jgi:AraC-like DNA-binding protein